MYLLNKKQFTGGQGILIFEYVIFYPATFVHLISVLLPPHSRFQIGVDLFPYQLELVYLLTLCIL